MKQSCSTVEMPWQNRWLTLKWSWATLDQVSFDLTAPGRADGTLTGPRMIGIPKARKQLHASLRLSSRVQWSHKLERGAPTATRRVTSSTRVQESRWAVLLWSRLLTELEPALCLVWQPQLAKLVV